MSLKHTLLGFLNYYPMTGYELKKFFDTSVAHFWNAEQSQIYAALKQLEAEDLVEMRVEVQTDRPNRKVYSITEDGRDELLEWLATPAEAEQVREPLLIKLFFGRVLQREQLLAVLRAQLADLRRVTAMYTGDAMDTVHKFAAAAGMQEDARLWQLTVEAGITHHRAATEFVEHAISQLEQMDDAMFGAVAVKPGDPGIVDARSAQKVLDKIAEDKPGLRVSTQERKSKNGNNAVATKGASS